ncbi:MAG: tRNA uridine-5-carboxymethylaminomethyl(34) synthesis GTPase MnmE [Candidatus Omnitrophica bacterium]|nr:tRNA uridine-5-carboxymethylaminomethyl(34) synthesis GTPase MnmE [Candidatus Omnitrophota bacterium]MDD5552816.1 tRNA uridine-5-carboxymethylaminomethyl(34) synthesis GTPase MnmE [Candidatus Omnitrophota bacterium]
MIKYDTNDTIAAVATGMGDCGIAIVRISGKDALTVAEKVFVSRDGEKPSRFRTYTIHYGWIVKAGEKGVIDEVILSVMRAPRSYTKEDVVEINCHGGIIATMRVLDLVLDNGCRMAAPGEFTKRAFLNGRIDLAQAEAVLDIIRAKTDSALRLGVEQLGGGLSKKLSQISGELLGILSLLEAAIDFPEEGIGSAESRKIPGRLRAIDKALKELLESSRRGKILREGVRAVICGKPNVGKSSLLNALLKQERSIVTPVAGTTRDTIEEIIDIKGIPVRIVDTAGIIEPRDLVEKKAVQRSKKYVTSADLIIFLLDGSKPLSRQDVELAEKMKGKKVIAIINKIDLKQKINRDRACKIFSRVIEISAKKLININVLESAIADMVFGGKIAQNEPAMVSRLRHIEILKVTQKIIARSLDSLDNKFPDEFVAQDIKDALGGLDGLLGKRFSESLLDRIFSDFCIGK